MNEHDARPNRTRRPSWPSRVAAGAAIALTLLLSACGSSTAEGGSSTPAPAPSASSRAASSTTEPARAADCTERALLEALPDGADMLRYTCAEAGGTEWAAARVDPGSTVFFLRWERTRWVAEESSAVCGTASAGLPPSLLDYCAPAGSSSPRPTKAPTTPARPSAADCTSAAILEALPKGATMQRFTCAPVGGTTWAAARVDPGSTVFFLTWDGRRWDAKPSSEVCGSASAGLPDRLLAYCR